MEVKDILKRKHNFSDEKKKVSASKADSSLLNYYLQKI